GNEPGLADPSDGGLQLVLHLNLAPLPPAAHVFTKSTAFWTHTSPRSLSHGYPTNLCRLCLRYPHEGLLRSYRMARRCRLAGQDSYPSHWRKILVVHSPTFRIRA
ncbi:unnamed protein product, partial [Scytosiphon promiscuus]